MLALPAKNRATLPLTQRGLRLIAGIEKRIDPCLGGGAPFLCADIAALAPNTCKLPEGILAKRSRPPAMTTNLAALIGPINADKFGK